MSGHRTFAHLAPELLASPAISPNELLFGRWSIALGPTTDDAVATTCVNAAEARAIAAGWLQLAIELCKRETGAPADEIDAELIDVGTLARPELVTIAVGPSGAWRRGRELAEQILEQINRSDNPSDPC